MKDDIILKIQRFKTIQKEIEDINEKIEKEDIAKIKEVWNDRASDMYIENLVRLKSDFNMFKDKIEDTINVLSFELAKEEELPKEEPKAEENIVQEEVVKEDEKDE